MTYLSYHLTNDKKKVITTGFSENFYNKYANYNYEKQLEKDLLDIYNPKSYKMIDKLRKLKKENKLLFKSVRE